MGANEARALTLSGTDGADALASESSAIRVNALKALYWTDEQAALDYAESATNQRERRQIFYTLARKGNEADALALMDLVLTDAYEGQLTWGVYLATLQNEAARAATWEKFKTDFEQVIAKTPEIRKPQTARLVSYFCTSDEIDDAIAFVETQASLISGYERRLAQATESARLCAAFRAEKGTELAAALEAQ